MQDDTLPAPLPDDSQAMTNPSLPVGDAPPPAVPPAAATTAGNGPSRNWLIGLAGALAAVIVILIIVLVVVATAPPSATKILQNAKNANLKDATYSITAPLTINFSTSGTSAPTTVTLTGTGKLTTAKSTTTPSANDVSVSIPLIGSQNAIEAITVNKNLYLNLGALASLLGGTPSTAAQWLSVPIGNTSINLLSYSNLKDLKYIGSETINGHSTWHIRGTLSVTGENATPTASSTSTAPISGSATEDLWIRQDNSFPAKMQMTFNVSTAGLNLPSTSGTGTGGTTATPQAISGAMTLLFTAWNSNLDIAAPKNAVGFSGSGTGNPFPFPFPTPTP
jgi:hypothetical protein